MFHAVAILFNKPNIHSLTTPTTGDNRNKGRHWRVYRETLISTEGQLFKLKRDRKPNATTNPTSEACCQPSICSPVKFSQISFLCARQKKLTLFPIQYLESVPKVAIDATAMGTHPDHPIWVLWTAQNCYGAFVSTRHRAPPTRNQCQENWTVWEHLASCALARCWRGFSGDQGLCSREGELQTPEICKRYFLPILLKNSQLWTS